jgi:hypothetical protein
MKQALTVLWQTIMMVLVAWAGFLVGMFVPALRVSRVVGHTTISVRTYDYDWLIAVLLVYLLFLAVGAARKRLQETAITATSALVITIALLALFTQIGVKDTSLIG